MTRDDFFNVLDKLRVATEENGILAVKDLRDIFPGTTLKDGTELIRHFFANELQDFAKRRREEDLALENSPEAAAWYQKL